jgi:hypothetical protein
MNVINPLATLCAGGMMMDTLVEPTVAKAINQASHDALASGKIKSLSAGKMGIGTREVGDMIAKLVTSISAAPAEMRPVCVWSESSPAHLAPRSSFWPRPFPNTPSRRTRLVWLTICSSRFTRIV